MGHRHRLAFLSLGVIALGLHACATPAPAPDAAVQTDAGSDAGPPLPPCEIAAPIIAGTPETDALADAPARCGAPTYAWLDDPTLGTVVERRRAVTFTASGLEALVGAAGLSLPRSLEHDVAVDTVVYVTQDRGRLVQSTAAVGYPVDLDARETLPTLLMLHGTTGWTTRCGPTLETNFRVITAALASLGFVVVSPDFLGLESAGTAYGAPPPYLVGEPTAIAALDAVRAGLRALSDQRVPACGTTDIVVWGASQGGHAALWLDRLAPYYAREIHLQGVVAAIPASDVVAHAERSFSESIEATHFLGAMMATAPAWYGLGDRLDEVFTAPSDTEVPAALAADCNATFPTDPIGALLTPLVVDAATAGTLDAIEPWGCILEESSLLDTSVPRLSTAGDPSYGILFIEASNDPLLVPAIEGPAYDTLCADGVPLQYLECEGAGHAEGAMWSLAETLDFLEARVRGDAFTAECTRPAAVRCSGTP